MGTEKFVKSDSQVSAEDFQKSHQLPQAWAITIGWDPETYWKNQENGYHLEACEEAGDDGSYQVPDEIFEEHDKLMFGEGE